MTAELRETLERVYDEVEGNVDADRPSVAADSSTLEDLREEEPHSEPTAGSRGEGPDEGRLADDDSVGTPEEEETSPAGEGETGGEEAHLEGEVSGDQETSETPSSSEEQVIPPAAWRGEAKQHWKGLPLEVQKEVARREREVTRVLRESNQARAFQQTFERVVQPFQSFMAADGVDALTATQNLMRTAASLRVGSPQQRAQTVAGIVRQYGVDIGMLDSVLVGEAPAQGAPGGVSEDAIARVVDQRLAPVTQMMGSWQESQRAAQETLQSEVSQEIDAFEADPENIFYADVRDDMANLLETAGRSGKKMSLKQAYNAAVSMNPELAAIQKKREAAEQARKQKAEMVKRKRAAASVRGAPVKEKDTSAPTTLRGVLEQQWDAAVSAGSRRSGA